MGSVKRNSRLWEGILHLSLALEHCALSGSPQYQRDTEVLERAWWWTTVLVWGLELVVCEEREAARAGPDQHRKGKAEGKEPITLLDGSVSRRQSRAFFRGVVQGQAGMWEIQS